MFFYGFLDLCDSHISFPRCLQTKLYLEDEREWQAPSYSPVFGMMDTIEEELQPQNSVGMNLSSSWRNVVKWSFQFLYAKKETEKNNWIISNLRRSVLQLNPSGIRMIVPPCSCTFSK
uniref:Uncharacterized protein n=1 Tax=Micrurus lemniscatus lemniscatus TaxID=129467 RepID=A0A2D4IQA6_MICLE